MSRHGEIELRGHNAPQSRYHSRGTFGRLFPGLEEFALPDTEEVKDLLRRVGAPGGIMNPGDDDRSNPDNPVSPAGYTFLGQFIDHDITLDPTSQLGREADPEAIFNFRTPALELDSVYGLGPTVMPHLYDRDRLREGRTQFLVDYEADAEGVLRDDLPRNRQGTALTGDPRNDENAIVAQLHLAFLKFHNFVVDDIWKPGRDAQAVFAEAQRVVRWHYQWIILHEFLPLTVGSDLVGDILTEEVPYPRNPRVEHQGRRFFDWRHEPFIPVEFSVGAYRFGHSQVRASYALNAELDDVRLFPARNGEGDRSLAGGRRDVRTTIQWDRFFDLGGARGVPLQSSKRIDTVLSGPLFALPFAPPGPEASLAVRNLLRHVTFGVPSGQAVARAMGMPVIGDDESRGAFDDLPEALQTSTPLWFYILREAALHANEGGEQGTMLVGAGARIVAEVLIGLLEGDRQSFVRQDPRWKPTYGTEDRFSMSDLLRIAKAGQ